MTAEIISRTTGQPTIMRGLTQPETRMRLGKDYGQLWERAAEGPNAAQSDKVTASQMTGILAAWIHGGSDTAQGARGHAVHPGCPQASGVIIAGVQVK